MTASCIIDTGIVLWIYLDTGQIVVKSHIVCFQRLLLAPKCLTFLLDTISFLEPELGRLEYIFFDIFRFFRFKHGNSQLKLLLEIRLWFDLLIKVIFRSDEITALTWLLMCGLRGCRHLLLAILRLNHGIFEWLGTSALRFILISRILLHVYRYKRDLVDILWGQLNWCRRLFLSFCLLCFELFDCWKVLIKRGRNWYCLCLFCNEGFCIQRLWRRCLGCRFSKVLTKKLAIKYFFDPLACWIMYPLLSYTWSLGLSLLRA